VKEVRQEMNHRNLNILCNPLTHQPLKLKKKNHHEILIDEKSKQEFLIQNGVPSFIDASEVSGTNQTSTKFYDIAAPFYGMIQKLWYLFWGGEANARKEYLKYLDIKDGDKVLEVSVGSGKNINVLPRTAQYYGLDISWGQLKQCQRNNQKNGLDIELFWGKAEHLPFLDETFQFTSGKC
jgi:uncharacterized protein YbaR (Trm112 family)